VVGILIFVSSGLDCLCGLVVRVPGYTTEIYCASCEVRTEFICNIEESRPDLSLESADPSVTALARISSNCKLQARTLVREGATK
jgi:hypothetical protein